MLSYRVIVLSEAFNDIDSIIDYLKRDSPQNAVAMADRLLHAAKQLRELPHRYKAYRAKHDPRRCVRAMPVPPYIVYYRIIETPPTVRILTIRHGARRQPRNFE